MEREAIIEQFFDRSLAHSSYAVLKDRQIILIDPARDPTPYLGFAKKYHSQIIGVIETHPHADFVSSHLELHHLTGAAIYASASTGALYPHVSFDDGSEIVVGDMRLLAINTPGHSPDSICILMVENDKMRAVFTGDTLFAGDVGRPDLRETSGTIVARKEELARDLYRSTRTKLMILPNATAVYPSHGPGSLCGKHMSQELSSTIGHELTHNYALKPMTEGEFTDLIMRDQPFIPKYFGFNVELNKTGAAGLKQALATVPWCSLKDAADEILLIDTRSASDFRKTHRFNSINIPDGSSFETWLGTIVAPSEKFYLLADSAEAVERMLAKAAKIGYEKNVIGLIAAPSPGMEHGNELDKSFFRDNPEKFTIVDIRNENETANGTMFQHAVTIPLPELSEHLEEIPQHRPVVVHCAGGYRSAIGSSLLSRKFPKLEVFDLGEEISAYR